MTVYVPTNSDVIQEITLNFDDHGYTSEMMQYFQEICFYTFKVMFADLTDESIHELIRTLIEEAYEREINEWYSFGTIPGVLMLNKKTESAFIRILAPDRCFGCAWFRSRRSGWIYGEDTERKSSG